MSGFSGGFMRPAKDRGSFVPMYWGDGSDGILTAGDVYHAGTDYDKYSGFCIKQFASINWVPGSLETLTVDEPCRGLILFVKDNINIGANATISMAKMGSVLPANPAELIDLYGESVQMRHIVDTLKTLHGGIGGDGGNGGVYNGGTPGYGGTGGAGRVCQGGLGAGGGGAVAGSGKGGDGGDILLPEVIGQSGGSHDGASSTAKSGWNGGAGGARGDAYNPSNFARAGGKCFGAGPGGGSWGSTAIVGGNGEHTGGFILVISKGSICISGSLDVSGGNGGATNGSGGGGGGGGGAGGGVIAVFARGVIDTVSATKTLTGGAGGAGYQSGTAGGNGTCYQERI